MNRFLLLSLFILSVLFFGCDKIASDQIKYEVTLINCSSWSGSYFNQDASLISITGGSSGWTKSFTNSNGLTALSLQAIPDNFGTVSGMDALLKIYVNGQMVASGNYSSLGSQGLIYSFP